MTTPIGPQAGVSRLSPEGGGEPSAAHLPALHAFRQMPTADRAQEVIARGGEEGREAVARTYDATLASAVQEGHVTQAFLLLEQARQVPGLETTLTLTSDQTDQLLAGFLRHILSAHDSGDPAQKRRAASSVAASTRSFERLFAQGAIWSGHGPGQVWNMVGRLKEAQQQLLPPPPTPRTVVGPAAASSATQAEIGGRRAAGQSSAFHLQVREKREEPPAFLPMLADATREARLAALPNGVLDEPPADLALGPEINGVKVLQLFHLDRLPVGTRLHDLAGREAIVGVDRISRDDRNGLSSYGFPSEPRG